MEHFGNADSYRAAIMKKTNDSEKSESDIPQLSVSLWIDQLKADDRDATENYGNGIFGGYWGWLANVWRIVHDWGLMRKVLRSARLIVFFAVPRRIMTIFVAYTAID